MDLRRILIGATAVTGLALGAQSASAGTICSGCEVIDGADGTYIGLYNPENFDMKKQFFDILSKTPVKSEYKNVLGQSIGKTLIYKGE